MLETFLERPWYMTTKKDIGKAVRDARKDANLSQENLGLKLKNHVRKETIGRLERGISNYNIDLLFDIAESLGVDLAMFCPGPERKKVIDLVEEGIEYAIAKRLEERRRENKKGN
jgi:transcriptional regulator with XRE-family HTH domain